MLTLERFKAMTASYGAEAERWPVAMRTDAEALLRVSPEARQLLAEARELDEAIGVARRREEAKDWPPGEEAAALARLRANVARALRPVPREDSAAPGRLGGLRSRVLPFAQWSRLARVAGMAAASAFLITAGLLLGSLEVVQPAARVDVLAVLQPTPLPFLADQ